MKLRVIPFLVILCCLPLLTVTATARSAETVRMWDVVRSAEWELTVRSVERRLDPLPGLEGGAAVRAHGQFAIFRIDLTNRTDRSLVPQSGDFVLGSADGMRWVNLGETPVARAYAGGVGLTPFGDVVAPGATVTTVVMFDIDVRVGRL